MNKLIYSDKNQLGEIIKNHIMYSGLFSAKKLWKLLHK